MNYKQISSCLLTVTLLFLTTINLVAQNSESGRPDLPGENVILQWNRVLTDTIRTVGAHPSATIFPFRSYAIMHIAMFDAVNSIDGRYTPYWTEVNGAVRASQDAAAARAARDILVALYPTRQAIYDAELENALVGISPGRAENGQRVGATVAARMIALRATDGWSVTPPAYVLGTGAGNWQPAAPQNAIATFTHFPGVLPFAISSNSQFSVATPPAMTTAEYARDYNEVKEIGSATSTTRTADQSRVANLWAGVNTTTSNFLAWNNVARNISVAQNLGTIEMARLFALFNISVHDTLQTNFTSKFQLGLWRPVTAIRRADEDGNTATSPDANWVAFIANPPYPAYPGNNAAIGMSHATIFALVFGRDDIPYQHTWEGAGGMTRSYLGFTAMAQEQADSRIYGGIHYRFDNLAGQSVGRNVANYVYQNFMTLRRCDVDRGVPQATASSLSSKR
jgi:hypothetical protein